MAVLLDHDDVELLLRELAGRLHADGVNAGIRVVGGAAIALINADRRSTADIDAVLLPAAPVRAMAATMAVERDLPADWLNDAAMAYVPLVGLDDWHEVFRVGDVASVQDAQEIYERYHAQDVLTDSAVARVQSWLETR